MKNKVLSGDLSSLLKDEMTPIKISQASNPLNVFGLIGINVNQPRKYFDEEKIKKADNFDCGSWFNTRRI